MESSAALAKGMEIIHYPNLKTVLAVESVIKEADGPITRAEIKRRLDSSIMHQTLNVILAYLEENGLIYDGRKGIIWLKQPGKKLQKLIDGGIEA